MGIRNFFLSKRGEKSLKIFYRICLGIIIFFWGMVGISYASTCVQKTHIYPLKYKEQVVKESKINGIDPFLVFALIKTESSFNKNAVSNKGAIGLMQLKTETALFMAQMTGDTVKDLTDPDENVKLGCRYLAYLFRRFENMRTAIIAYNAGEGKVGEWLKDKRYSQDGKTLTEIPFTETREYIKKIEKSFSKYKNLYSNIVDKNKIFE